MNLNSCVDHYTKAWLGFDFFFMLLVPKEFLWQVLLRGIVPWEPRGRTMCTWNHLVD